MPVAEEIRITPGRADRNRRKGSRAKPWQRNTRLSVVARNALKPHLPADAVATIERQVDAGQLTLDELDKLVDGGAGRGVVAILFDTGDPIAVALAYLNSDGSDDLDTRISKRDCSSSTHFPVGGSVGASEL